MRRHMVWIAGVTAVFGCSPPETSDSDVKASYPPIGRVERLDPRIDGIIPEGAVIESLTEGHLGAEGPVWVPELESVLYSDTETNEIYRWNERDGDVLWLAPSGYTGSAPRGGEMGSNGLFLDVDGRLLLAQHGDRRIARLIAPLDAPTPRFETLASEFDGRRLNSPNDLTVHSNGSIYFTDPFWGLEGRRDDPAAELDVAGIYRVTPAGSVELLVSDLRNPNGIALSPDERTLYVATTGGDTRGVVAYDVADDGSLTMPRLVFPDGLGVDVDNRGNLYVVIRTDPDAVFILAPDGTHLGSLHLPLQITNVAFGDDGHSLFITSKRSGLQRIRLVVQGVGF